MSGDLAARLRAAAEDRSEVRGLLIEAADAVDVLRARLVESAQAPGAVAELDDGDVFHVERGARS